MFVVCVFGPVNFFEMPAESVTACLFLSYHVRNRSLTAVLSSIVTSFWCMCKAARQYIVKMKFQEVHMVKLIVILSLCF